MGPFTYPTGITESVPWERSTAEVSFAGPSDAAVTCDDCLAWRLDQDQEWSTFGDDEHLDAVE